MLSLVNGPGSTLRFTAVKLTWYCHHYKIFLSSRLNFELFQLYNVLYLGALANNGCSIDQSVLEPRPFHKGWTFHGCDAQTDENSVVPSGTTCKQVWCNQFKFSKAYNVECRDGAWSELPTCFKGCPAPTSKAG